MRSDERNSLNKSTPSYKADLVGVFGNPVAENPTIVMLALGFLLMIGTTLIADGMGFHVPKGYIYAAMGFSALVEGLNMLARSRKKGPGPTH